ncbi:hypothetical protein HAX54_041673 [Datura stramonium]|uniref:Uncharacterized protein n=1 Tax=Datura stramonium TaxID=4076 RepID=A0ABS8W0H3_DATST|nr:hypothetical protein [Datura stramonium]
MAKGWQKKAKENSQSGQGTSEIWLPLPSHSGGMVLPPSGGESMLGKQISAQSGNKLAEQGMSLTYVTPSLQNGEKVVELSRAELNRANETWRTAIILYVIGASPPIASLERLLALIGHDCSEEKHTNPVMTPKYQDKAGNQEAAIKNVDQAAQPARYRQ